MAALAFCILGGRAKTLIRDVNVTGRNVRNPDWTVSPAVVEEDVRLARSTHTPFILVLAGGGARGMAHAGVLRALAHYGYRPCMIVGISMGAVVGAAYALNPDWYRAVLTVKAPRIFRLMDAPVASAWSKIQEVVGAAAMLCNLVFGWGLGAGTVKAFRGLLQELTLGRSLEEGDPLLSIIATDLLSGQCTVLCKGNAGEAVFASSALAGMLPPLALDDFLLADGGYADLPPLRSFAKSGSEKIIMVDPDRYSPAWTPKNGIQTMIRASEVAMQGHACRFARDTDLILCPQPRAAINAFDFAKRRVACAAGIRVVRNSIYEIRELLSIPESAINDGMSAAR